MSWLFFSLLAALLWGVGQILLKKGYSQLSPLWSAVVSAILNAFIYIPFAFFMGVDLHISYIMLFIIFAITTLYIFFYYAIEKGQLSFAGTLFATYPVTTLILSFIFLNERPSPFQLLMILLIILGTALLSYYGTQHEKGRKIKTTWVVWALFGAITTGAGDFGAKVVLNNIPLQTYNFYYPLLYLLSIGAFWFVDKKGRKPTTKLDLKQFRWTIPGVAMLTLGLLSLNYALSHGPVSLSTAVSSSYVGLTVILSYVFLHESITKKQLASLLLIIVGVMLIGLI